MFVAVTAHRVEKTGNDTDPDRVSVFIHRDAKGNEVHKQIAGQDTQSMDKLGKDYPGNQYSDDDGCCPGSSSSDTVYMIDSAHDSSSGIASDDHNGTNSSPSTGSYSTDIRAQMPHNGHLALQDQRTFVYHDIDNDADDEETYGCPLPLRDYYPELRAHAPGYDGNKHRQHPCTSPSRHAGHNHNKHSQEILYNQNNLHPTPPHGGSTIQGMTNLGENFLFNVKRKSKVCYFDIVPDDVMTRIFSHLPSDQLCRNALVCRRWYNIVWEPSLWSVIQINNGEVDADRAIKVLTKRLSYDTPSVCVMVEKINLNGCAKLSDKGLNIIARRCPELRHLEVQGCTNISNIAMFEVVSRCVNLEHLTTAGCPCITCICLTPEATVQATAYGKQIFLRYLDMTDCFNLEDSGLQIIASYCSQLVYLYLRRCTKITDIGVQYVANYCSNLREFSISDCRKVTDFGMRELSKVNGNLRYLSVAKCDKISDVGIKYIAQYCHRLRYLNVRGCEAVSDDSIEMLARCCRRLKSLDIGKCDVTDFGLQILGEYCKQLRRLSLKSCDSITDNGIIALANHCRAMQQLNIQDCHLTVEAYRAVKRNCKRCIIEHTNPGFY